MNRMYNKKQERDSRFKINGNLSYIIGNLMQAYSTGEFLTPKLKYRAEKLKEQIDVTDPVLEESFQKLLCNEFRKRIIALTETFQNTKNPNILTRIQDLLNRYTKTTLKQIGSQIYYI